MSRGLAVVSDDTRLVFPLVVDLDKALLAADPSSERLVRAVLDWPVRMLGGQRMTPAAGAADGASDSECGPAPSEADRLAYRDDVLAWLRAEYQSGRTLHLAGTDPDLTKAVAARLGLFTAVIDAGPDGVSVAQLHRLCPAGFDYLGDAGADPAVLRAAGTVHLVNATAPFGGAEHPAGRAFPPLKASWRVWLRALRVQQWSKNVIIFVPLILSRSFADPVAVAKVFAAFFLFSAVTSANYLINDLMDLAADRQHPRKRSRPLAAGLIAPATALAVAAGLIVAGFAASLVLSPAFAGALFAYLAVALIYTLSIKRMALADVVAISVLFTLRIGAGALVIPVFVSPWLMSFSVMFFLSLALTKRNVEVVRAGRVEGYKLEGRGYVAADWPFTLTVGVGATFASIVIMLLYIQEAAVAIGGFSRPIFLYPIALIIMFWSLRVWMLSHRAQLDDDPVAFAFKDRLSFVMAALTAGLLGLAV